MPDTARLSTTRKAALYGRIWRSALGLELSIRRRPLPSIVADISKRPSFPESAVSVAQMRRAVDGTLRFGPWRPRCLVRALVLYEMLHEAGVVADLVIGLPASAPGIDAHAWVEVDRRSVGPWPGRSGHEEFARFGPEASG